MSRYTGPRVRAARALGTELPGLTRKSHERRPYRPGQHGQARKKLSEYATRLLEKQKLRMNYGLTERQMLGLMLQASSGKGNTGQELLVLLERRLDNAVFRAGFARTIPAARQLVNHGHVLVNERRVDVPSYQIRQGDVIRLRERSKQLPHVAAALATPLSFPTEWLSVDADERKATVTSLPDASSVPFPVNVQRVVEFYSQRT